MAETSINLPQIIAVALVSFFAIRWLMSKPNPSSRSEPSQRPSSSRSTRIPGAAIDITKVDQVSAMFPQIDRRHIAWDLQRNGGNVAATIERVLNGPGLENPPPSFQPVLPLPSSNGNGGAAAGVGEAGGTSSTAAAARKANGSSKPDLITRYNLQSRLGGKGKEPVPSEEQKRAGVAWSSDKVARAEGLRKRREEMILAARRAMEDRDAGPKS